jgi:hypothetical protein
MRKLQQPLLLLPPLLQSFDKEADIAAIPRASAMTIAVSRTAGLCMLEVVWVLTSKCWEQALPLCTGFTTHN